MHGLDVRRLVLDPRDALADICARQSLGWALAVGVVGSYWRVLPASEALLSPIAGAAVYLAGGAILAGGWTVLVATLIHVATRLLGHRRGRWRDMVLLWGYAQLPAIPAVAATAAVITLGPGRLRPELDLVWVVGAVTIVGVLLLWRLALEFQAIKVCYDLSGWPLARVIGVALALYGVILFAESTFIDDRGPVPSPALRAMSIRLPLAVPAYMSLPFDRLAYRLGTPRRGEIMGFAPAGSPESFFTGRLSARVRFLGRIVGLPGERVEVRAGRVYLNGQPYGEPYPTTGARAELGATQLGEGQYLVLGDNRDLATSEYHGGLVSERDIRGRLSVTGQWRLQHLAGEPGW